MDRTPAGPNLPSSDPATTLIPRWDLTCFDVHDSADFEVDRLYASVDYHSSAAVAWVHLARDAACKRTRRTYGCHWDNLNALDYVVQIKLLQSCRFGAFTVERQVGRVVVNGMSQMSQMTFYGTWNMWMVQWWSLEVYRVRVQLDIPFYWNRDKRTYVTMFGSLIRNHNDGRTTRPGKLSYCLLCPVRPFSLLEKVRDMQRGR